ncbi:PE family protein [Mycolicibacterium sp.]|uniref:PE family protein n=1 Tax=Mycolicibacterium sp. TaxID=2320850 RepID=UPI003D13B3DB
MPTNAELSLQPDEVIEATTQLDDLATRVETLLRAEGPNLAVTAPGVDEVSQRVAATLNEVHQFFTASTDAGVAELREIAATLRAHTDAVVAAEQDFVV